MPRGIYKRRPTKVVPPSEPDEQEGFGPLRLQTIHVNVGTLADLRALHRVLRELDDWQQAISEIHMDSEMTVTLKINEDELKLLRAANLSYNG